MDFGRLARIHAIRENFGDRRFRHRGCSRGCTSLTTSVMAISSLSLFPGVVQDERHGDMRDKFFPIDYRRASSLTHFASKSIATHKFMSYVAARESDKRKKQSRSPGFPAVFAAGTRWTLPAEPELLPPSFCSNFGCFVFSPFWNVKREARDHSEFS
jgi:hypothetical protein